MSIEICDICCRDVGMFKIRNQYVVIKLLDVNGSACPIIAKETEINKRCSSSNGSSASLALIASYSVLNARLDALLSPVSYR